MEVVVAPRCVDVGTTEARGAKGAHRGRVGPRGREILLDLEPSDGYLFVGTAGHDGGLVVMPAIANSAPGAAEYSARKPDGGRSAARTGLRTVGDRGGELRRSGRWTRGFGQHVAIAQGGHLWATASADVLHIWRDDRLERTIQSPGEAIQSLRFGVGDEQVLAAPHIYDLALDAWVDRTPLPVALRESDPAWGAVGDRLQLDAGDFRPNGQGLVICVTRRPSRRAKAGRGEGPDRRVLLLDGASGAYVQTLWAGPAIGPPRIRAADGLVAAAWLPSITLWRLPTQSPPLALERHTMAVADLAFSADERVLASVGYDREIVAWDPAGVTEPVAWQGHAEAVTAVAVDASGTHLVTGGRDLKAKLWHLDGSGPGRCIAEVQLDEPVVGIALAPDGRSVLVTSRLRNEFVDRFDIEPTES